MSGVIASGFVDPSLDAQDVFRAALAALAEPGTQQSPKRQLPSVRHPLYQTTFALAMALADGDTPLWLDHDDPDLAADFRFHCGCKIAAERGEAGFAIVTQPGKLEDLSVFALGSADYPDRSTTLLVQVEAFDRGAGFRLTGPGNAMPRDIRIDGLPGNFATLWRDNRAHWPRGVDLFLVTPERYLGLPRTTVVEDI